MSTYNQMFKLTLKDVDLIEQSIRHQIAQLAAMESMPEHQSPEGIDNHKKIIELMVVLGNLHNQKIWYGQTHRTGIPLG